MIISASYRTDIPAFYGEWFSNRLRAGYCKAVNPYSGQIYTVDLSPEQVDGLGRPLHGAAGIAVLGMGHAQEIQGLGHALAGLPCSE